MKQIICLIAVLIVGNMGLLGGNIAHADSSNHVVWVFPDDLSPNLITDQTAQQIFVDDSSDSGVTAFYLSVFQSTPNSSGRLMYEDSDIADLIQQARRNHIGVWAAYGAPDWPALGCDSIQFPLQRMAEVVNYNKENPSSAKFKGVVLDVEPPEPQSDADFQDLLTLYQCIRDSLPNYMGLSVAIRFFWDTPVEFKGSTKPAFQHIIDLDIDKIVVMGYRDFAGTSDCNQGDGIICLNEDEIAYADSIKGKRRDRILIGLETANCAPECGPEKVTFFEEGQMVLNSEAQFVILHFDKNASFGGFAIHRYGDSYLGELPGWPAVNLEFP